MQEKLDIVIPLAPADVDVFLKGVYWIKRFLPAKKIIVIGNEKVEELLNGYKEIHFINENELIPYNLISSIIADIGDNDVRFVKRTGWYLQQFLKMQYAYLCDDDYYLLWDGDSIPTCRINFFEKDKPIFGLKKEFHEAYFITMNRLLPELKKSTTLSYVSEHMIISTSLMKELISKIEEKGQDRQRFYECILRKIDKRFLDKSGFSEYETYGTFCKVLYPGKYVEKEWHSIRPANYYFDIDKLTEDDLYWMSKGYEAVSFEFYETQENKKYIIKSLQFIFRLKWLRKLFPVHIMCAPVETIRSLVQKWRKYNA